MKRVVAIICVLMLHCATATPPQTPQPPGYLGFMFSYYPPTNDEQRGWLLIQHVVDDSPAASAGLQPQMVVVAFNDRPLDYVEDAGVLNLLNAIRPGDRVRMTLGGQHAGEQLTLTATVMPPDAVRRWRANFE
ncbi:MAG TPA: PDZ domain-containing protein [Thermoanaerobaculia bacterium]|nr:PDZ domain-containing protein [Thermoanaerobaculia bacterium]